MQASVSIHLHDGILDPQGKATCQASHALGFSQVTDIKIGKEIIIKVDTNDHDEAQKIVESLCDKLLVNQVIEHYHINAIKPD